MSENTLVTTPECIYCHKSDTILVPTEGLAKYKAGAFVQDAFPTLSADVREQILTGTHGPCFDEIFPEEDDDE